MNCLLLAVALLPVAVWAQQAKTPPGSEECVACHDTGRRTGKREAGMPPPFDAAALKASPHGTQECVACHADADPKKLPHADKLARVDCAGISAAAAPQAISTRPTRRNPTHFIWWVRASPWLPADMAGAFDMTRATLGGSLL